MKRFSMTSAAVLLSFLLLLNSCGSSSQAPPETDSAPAVTTLDTHSEAFRTAMRLKHNYPAPADGSAPVDESAPASVRPPSVFVARAQDTAAPAAVPFDSFEPVYKKWFDSQTEEENYFPHYAYTNYYDEDAPYHEYWQEQLQPYASELPAPTEPVDIKDPEVQSQLAAGMESDVEAASKSFAEGVAEGVVSGLAMDGVNFIFSLLNPGKNYAAIFSQIQNDLAQINQQLASIEKQATTILANQTRDYDHDTQVQAQQDFLKIQTTYSSIVNDLNVQQFDSLYNNFATASLDCSDPKSVSDLTDAFYDRHDNSNNILFQVGNALNNLFNYNGSSTDNYLQQVTTESASLMQDIRDLENQDMVTSYYMYGLQLSQFASMIGQIQSQAYMTLATTLQYIYECPAVYDALNTDTFSMLAALYGPLDDLAKVPNNACNLTTALETLSDNYRAQIHAKAQQFTSQLSAPYQQGDIFAALLSPVGLTFDQTFTSMPALSQCIPVSYIANYEDRDLNYLAADCLNPGGTSSVYLLYIPTSNGSIGMNHIGFLEGFGLTGEVQYSNIRPYLARALKLTGNATPEFEKPEGFGFCGAQSQYNCAAQYVSVQLANNLLSLGTVDAGWTFTPDATMNRRLYVEPRYNYSGNAKYYETQYFLALTPNGHLFYGSVGYQTVSAMLNGGSMVYSAQVEFGLGAVVEQGNVGPFGSYDPSLVYNLFVPDNTAIWSTTGTGMCPSNYDNLPQWGFGAELVNAPQPDAATLHTSSSDFASMEEIKQAMSTQGLPDVWPVHDFTELAPPACSGGCESCNMAFYPYNYVENSSFKATYHNLGSQIGDPVCQMDGSLFRLNPNNPGFSTWDFRSYVNIAYEDSDRMYAGKFPLRLEESGGNILAAASCYSGDEGCSVIDNSDSDRNYSQICLGGATIIVQSSNHRSLSGSSFNVISAPLPQNALCDAGTQPYCSDSGNPMFGSICNRID